MQMIHLLLTIFSLLCLSCSGAEPATATITVGAERTAEYLPSLVGKRVAVLANHTAMVGQEHLVDMLIGKGVNLVGIFSPEHGFRGMADAGEHVASSVDEKTGVPIWSLYDGNAQRPSDEKMRAFDVLLVDMQDVGLRFYTYYITMLRMMDACADFGCRVIVLDRPNPNGMYAEEICTAARYIGLSKEIRNIFIFGQNHFEKQLTVCNKLVSEVIWHICEGIASNIAEDPDNQQSDEYFQRKMVSMGENGETITFLTSYTTKRWWMEVPSKEGKNTLVPCSINDYQCACTGEIPLRWLFFYQKQAL